MLLGTSLNVLIACNLTVTPSDLRSDTAKLNVPALVIHGDADQSAPLALTGRKVAALIPHCRFEIYEGAPHGLFLTHMHRLNADLLEFVASGKT
jgi:pimeloyl-ACP methyl ester carboxylesterase